jgi:hypothetical protein
MTKAYELDLRERERAKRMGYKVQMSDDFGGNISLVIKNHSIRKVF